LHNGLLHRRGGHPSAVAEVGASTNLEIEVDKHQIIGRIEMKTKISLLATVAFTGLISTPLYAQATPSVAADNEEEIVVTGIRGSLEKAAEIKRESLQIMDVITSEDVGKLPDPNVAEALQRVTGVQITRVFGEGQSVNIRGLQQVRVEVDGRTLLGWSARVSPPENDNLGRSSGLDSVPSSLFGRLEVRKSPLSSQAEGGLGGTVNLVTPKPFSFKKPTISLRAQGTYSDRVDKFEPGFAGLATTTFADDRIGVVIAGEYQKRSSNLQLFERNNWFPVGNGGVGLPAGATTILAPRLLQYENVDIDRTRWGINGAVQFRVTDDWIITADGMYSNQKSNRTNQFVALNLATPNPNATTAAARNPIVSNSPVVDEFGYAVAGQALGNIRTGNQIRLDPTTSLLAGINTKYDDGTWTIEADGYYSRGTLRQKIEVITLQTRANAVVGVYDFRNSKIPSLSVFSPISATNPLASTNAFDLTSPANFPLPRTTTTSALDNLLYRANLLPANLDEWTTRFDVGYDNNNGVKLSAGARYVKLTADFTSFRSRSDGLYTAGTIVNSRLPGGRIDVPGIPTLATTYPDFLSQISGNFPRAFLTGVPDSDFILERVLTPGIGEPPLPGDPLTRNRDRDFVVNESTLSGYLMFDAEGEIFGRPAKMNAGVRISHTDFEADTVQRLPRRNPVTGATITPIILDASDRNDKEKYTNVLPSANVTVNATDDFLIRLSASQTLQRASIQDLAPSTFVDATNRTKTTGNAQLKPPISSNVDLSFEYYMGKSNQISAAMFYKSVDNFIVPVTFTQIEPGFESLGTIVVRSITNIPKAKVKGFELGVTQFFDFLPGPLSGLGIIANYTYVDSKDSNGDALVATSKHSYNIVGLYEKGPVSARLAYNWRSDAVFEFTDGRPEVIAARSQLDAQLGFDLAKNIQLSLQAQNLMPKKAATIERSGVNPTAINSYALSERRFSAGLRVKF
jgi:iron complex outermembrane recepter protein